MGRGKDLLTRSYQALFFLFSKFVRYKDAALVEGEGSSFSLGGELHKRNALHPLYVVDGYLHEHGIDKNAYESLVSAGLDPAIYLVPPGEPHFDAVNSAYMAGKTGNCDSVVAFGGGSAMDVAKGAAILMAYGGADISKFKGLLKVHRKLPTMVFVPTTAGTGSEITPCAVIAFPEGKGKAAIMSPRLIPDAAVLDPANLVSLPHKAAVYGALDAVSHAVESYLNRPRDLTIRRDAISALRLIFDNIEAFSKSREDLGVNRAMLKGSYLAGRAFAKGYVGYCHALSHAVGGAYGYPHGYLNAILLPYVLRAYGEKAVNPLARLEDALFPSTQLLSRGEKAASFIARLEALLDTCEIQKSLQIRAMSSEKALELGAMADKEANPLYHVPRIMRAKELASILLEANKER